MIELDTITYIISGADAGTFENGPGMPEVQFSPLWGGLFGMLVANPLKSSGHEPPPWSQIRLCQVGGAPCGV